MVKPKQIKATLATGSELETNEEIQMPEAASLGNLSTILAAHTAQFEKILAAIRDTKNALEAKIDNVALDVGLLRADHKKLSERVKEIEAVNKRKKREKKTCGKDETRWIRTWEN